MTTSTHFTLQSHDVYTFTSNTLDTLPLHMPGAIQSRDVLRVWSLLPPPGLRPITPVTSWNVPRLARPCWATCRASWTSGRICAGTYGSA
jgi:hypothetical protein